LQFTLSDFSCLYITIIIGSNLEAVYGVYLAARPPRTDASSAPPLPLPGARAFLHNALVFALVLLDASLSSGGEEAAGGPQPLSPEAAGARRRICIDFLIDNAKRDAGPSLYDLATSFGTVLGSSLLVGMRLFHPDCTPAPGMEAAWSQPAEAHLLYRYCAVLGDKGRPQEWITSCPFLGPLSRRRLCRTCGLVPGAVTDKPFQACSLCLDPSVGRFCCKEPCFAAFWRGGHKRECAGRDKMKKKMGEGK
jgi:hypothetical protein